MKAMKTLVDGNAKALGFPICGLCMFAGAVLMVSRVLHLLVRGGGCTPQRRAESGIPISQTEQLNLVFTKLSSYLYIFS